MVQPFALPNFFFFFFFSSGFPELLDTLEPMELIRRIKYLDTDRDLMHKRLTRVGSIIAIFEIRPVMVFRTCLFSWRHSHQVTRVCILLVLLLWHGRFKIDGTMHEENNRDAKSSKGQTSGKMGPSGNVGSSNMIR